MKKLALLLGSLTIAASAFAGGKEVIQKPVQPVVIKEVIKEVPVYQTKTVTNGGYVDVLYRWWGRSTKDDKDRAQFNGARTEGDSNRGRLQIAGSVNLTDRDKFYFRVRDHHAVGARAEENGEKIYGNQGSNQVRLILSHKHDFWNATSRLWYQNNGDANKNGEYIGFAAGNHNLEYQLQFQLAEYGLDNSFIKTTDFTIAPKVGYSWDDADKDRTKAYDKAKTKAATYYGGVDVYTSHSLPLNFWFEANFYLGYYGSNYKYYGDPKDNSKSTFGAGIEAYLKNKTPLVEFGDAVLSFYFEGGFDPYKYASEKVVVKDAYDGGLSKPNTNASYELYALPALQLDYQATESLKFYLVGGAEMRNYHAAASETSGWLWQPTAWAGFRKTF